MPESQAKNISGVAGVPLVQVKKGRHLRLLLCLPRAVLLTPGRALSLAVTLVTWADAVREGKAHAAERRTS